MAKLLKGQVKKLALILAGVGGIAHVLSALAILDIIAMLGGLGMPVQVIAGLFTIALAYDGLSK